MAEQKRRECGMMTVEAVVALVPFLLLILGIISFINLFLVHNRIQHAMYQSASELSGYLYFYDALGIRDGDLALKADIDAETEPLDNAISQITDFMGQLEALSSDAAAIQNSSPSTWESDIGKMIEDSIKAGETGGALIQTGKDLLGDPKGLLRSVLYFLTERAEYEGKSLIVQLLARGLLNKYLDQTFISGGYDADTYLKNFGVKNGLAGLKLDKSELFSNDRLNIINIVVEYDVEVYCFKLFFKDPTIHIVQQVEIPAWLDGDGVSWK